MPEFCPFSVLLLLFLIYFDSELSVRKTTFINATEIQRNPSGDLGGSGIDTVEVVDVKTVSLIVIVSSSDSAKEIIDAKIVWKKLSSDLVVYAYLPTPTSPATINVNAFL